MLPDRCRSDPRKFLFRARGERSCHRCLETGGHRCATLSPSSNAQPAADCWDAHATGDQRGSVSMAALLMTVTTFVYRSSARTHERVNRCLELGAMFITSFGSGWGWRGGRIGGALGLTAFNKQK